MNEKQTAIIFDLDGTLWDSSKQVMESWNLALVDYPEITRKITIADMHRNMGKTMDKIADDLLKEITGEKRKEVLGHCCKIENEYLSKVGGDIFEGAIQLLMKLHEDYKVFIVSNCQAGYIETFTQYYNINNYIDDIECPGNTGLKKGENIKLIMERNNIKRAVYIGDTHADYEATLIAGIPFIHAKYGYGIVEEAKYNANNIKEVYEQVNRVIENEIE